ncbi:MAG TPA: twin-arginine translocation signal domain-containing protein [Nocardioidaceae bacterium]|jgi:hypothetical protein
MGMKTSTARETSGRTRRGFLRGLAAGGAAWGLGAVAAPQTARAANGDPVLLGVANTATVETEVHMDGLGGALVGRNDDSIGSGVVGMNGASGPGVEAFSAAGSGVLGQSNLGSGVRGVTFLGGPRTAATVGEHKGSGRGVLGVSAAGDGVVGLSEGPGASIHALAGPGSAGLSLQVDGRAVFARSGKVAVPAGSSSVKVFGVALTESSLVLAMVQQAEGAAFVKWVVPHVVQSSFEIKLNKASSVPVRVAWFVVN